MSTQTIDNQKIKEMAMKNQGKVYYGWILTDILCLVTMFIMGPINYGFATLLKPLKTEFGWSVLAISGAMSIRGLVGILIAPICGTFVDKYGPRPVLIVGAILMGFGLIIFSTVKTLVMFYIAFAIIAIGLNCADVPTTMTAIASWFRKKIGLTSGIINSGMGLSGFMVPIIAWLMTAYGWRSTMMYLGLFMIIVVAPLCLLIKRRPVDLGWGVDGEPLQFDEKGNVILSASKAKRSDEQSITLGSAFRMKTFWLIAIVLIFNGMMISAISTHIINFGINIGFAATVAAFLSTILSSVSIGGRFFIGWASDKIDVRRILQFGYGLICIAMILGGLSGAGNRSLVFVMVTVFALGYGGMSVVRAQLVRSYFGIKAYGKIMGFLQSISTIGVVIGPLLGGGIFDATGSYRLLWLIYAVIALCPIVIAAVLQKPEFADDKIGSK